MDILDFVNSPDVAQYFRKINYRPNPVESAYIIATSERPWLQKEKAFEQLITSTEDCCVVSKYEIKESLHELLRSYIALKQKLHRRFYAAGGIWYARFGPRYDYFYEEKAFACPEDCLLFAKEYFHLATGTKFLHIVKVEDHEVGVIEATFDGDFQPIDYKTRNIEPDDYDTQLVFEWIVVNFPLPFKRGDVLVEINRDTWDDFSFVLDRIDSWDGDALKQNGVADRKLTKSEFTNALNYRLFAEKEGVEKEIFYQNDFTVFSDPDRSDLTLYRFADEHSKWLHQHAGGEVTAAIYALDSHIRINHTNYKVNPLNLQYFTPQPNSIDGILLVISAYIKGEIDLKMLLDSFRLLAIEELTYSVEYEKHTQDEWDVVGIKRRDKYDL